MDSEQFRFVEDAAQVATSGRWDAVNQRIEAMAANRGDPENVWWIELFAGLCLHVFSEYLLLKRAYEEGTARSVGEIAWRARNLLELSVWSMYCAVSRENARRFHEDATRDLNGVLAAFEEWEKATTQPAEWFEKGTSARQQMASRASSEGITAVDERFKWVSEAASEVGIGADFGAFNRLLSKCAHPAAMQIVFSANPLLTTWQIDTFFSNGCLFFVGAFSALERQILP